MALILSPDPVDLMVAFWAIFVADVNDPPPPGQEDATMLLQFSAPRVTDDEGAAFFVAVAVIYESMGLMNKATYIALRNEINREGEVVPNTVFDSIKARVAGTNEAQPVLNGLSFESLINEQAQIPRDIATIEADRDTKSDQALTDAYNQGIEALVRRSSDIASELTIGRSGQT